MAAQLFKSFLLVGMVFLCQAEPETAPRVPLLRRQASSPYVVKLDREIRKGLASNYADLTVYTATLLLGEAKPGREPQELRVVFDFSSGQVVVPSSECPDVTCFKHRRYNKWNSQTAQDINADGTSVHPTLAVVSDDDEEQVGGRDGLEIGLDSIDLGPGQVKGEMLKEKLCLTTEHGEMKCATLGIVAATSMSDLPFRVLPNDGIVGLGMSGVSLSPTFSFLKHFLSGVQARGQTMQQFGLFLGGEAGGEIAFGGYDAKRVQSPLAWVPVSNPEQGFWQMEILAVRVGNQTLDVCDKVEGGCRGLVDTGASHLSVPSTMASPLEEVLRTSLVGKIGSTDIQLVFDGATVTIPASSYAAGPGCLDNPAACRPMVARHYIADPIGRGVFVLGDSVLRPYYTVFDMKEKRIGFGATLGASSAVKAGLLSGAEDAAVSRNASSNRPSGVLLLIQVTTKRSVVML